MKLWSIILIMSFGFFLFGQKTVDNPEKPVNKDAGRVVRLAEVMRFTDAKQDFHFRFATHLKLDNEGNIYLENFMKILKFDSKGKYLFSILERGLGPGEIDSRPQFLIEDDSILIQVYKPPKVMFYSPVGKLDKEHKLEARSIDLIGSANGNVYFLEDVWLELAYEKGYVDVPLNLYETDPEFRTLKKFHSFPYRWYMFGGGGWQQANINHVIFEDQYIFVTHTAEYKISRFNINMKQVDRLFQRKYERVKRSQKPKRKLPPGSISAPQRKFHNDILTLLVVDEKLWVVTSASDEQQNRLIDVFDLDGVFMDSFYLEFPNQNKILNLNRGCLIYSNGHFFTAEQDEEGEISIAKYRLIKE